MRCTGNLEALLPSEYVEMMAEYLEKHHSRDIEAIMTELNNANSAHYSVNVSMPDLLEDNLLLGTMLLHAPALLLPYCDDAIRVVQKRILTVHGDAMFMTYKPSCHLRLYRLPHCPEIRKATVSSIRAGDINQLIQVPGTVIRTGQLKMLQSRRDYVCLKCRHCFPVVADVEQRHVMALPAECPGSGLDGKPCNGNKFEVREGSEVCRDFQEVRIQEQVHRLMVGSIPRSMTVLLQDDLVDKCKAGDDVTVVGRLIKRWRPLQKGVRCDVEMAIEALHVRVNNEERGGARVSREAVIEFETFWQAFAASPLAGRDFIVGCACPTLARMDLVKLALLLALLGGVSHVDESGMRVRGESHMLLVGDAGTGKSQVLRYAAKLSSRAVLTTGTGATSAGLTCTAVRDPGGEWMLEAGALVLADGGICAIDEFDSIREHDRGAIHEAMEQQTLSVAKAGLVCKLRTKCSVLAASNPKGARYDDDYGAHINLGIPSPLLSRFDIVLILRDAQCPHRDLELAEHILDDACAIKAPSNTDSQGQAGEAEAEGGRQQPRVPARWSLDKLRSYLEYVKGTFSPVLNDGAQRLLIEYYRLQRHGQARSTGRTTIRFLESMVRLAQAHARLMFRKEVTVMDAVYTVVLMEVSIYNAGIFGNSSALDSAFDQDPEVGYAILARTVFDVLKLDPDGAPLAQDARSAERW